MTKPKRVLSLKKQILILDRRVKKLKETILPLEACPLPLFRKAIMDLQVRVSNIEGHEVFTKRKVKARFKAANAIKDFLLGKSVSIHTDIDE